MRQGVRDAVAHAVEATKHNSTLRLVVALSYGGRQDIVQAAKTLARKVAAGELDVEDIDERTMSAHLSTGEHSRNVADQTPDLLIRTGGEQRLSNFLLWDLAYAELYFADTAWPEFGEAELRRALHAYATRDRRYGVGQSHDTR
jgi:undecaprenyl diphosphate synthase